MYRSFYIEKHCLPLIKRRSSVPSCLITEYSAFFKQKHGIIDPPFTLFDKIIRFFILSAKRCAYSQYNMPHNITSIG